MPKISVIVPVYKVEEYLRRCVDSILNQTFQDFELILVDDGSPDDCPKICDEYAQKDNRVFVIHKENGGLSDARNKGIDWAFENSDSEWITFIDSDDWVHEQYLEFLYKGVIENNCEISSCRYYSTKGELPEEKEGEIKVLSPEEFWTMPNSNAVMAWGKLYKKTLWKKYRFPKGKIHEDEYTTYKLLFSVDKICAIDKELYYYYYNESGITKVSWTPKRKNAIYAMKEQVKFFKKGKYMTAYRRQVWSLCFCYQRNIEEAMRNQINNENRKEIKKLYRGFRLHLISHRSVLPIRHYDDLYLYAYPNRKQIIAFFKRLDSKFARIIHNGDED